MITRCPECATAFRLTYELIEARRGRVRCGHCGNIFDAVAAMESVAVDLLLDGSETVPAGDPDAAPPVPPSKQSPPEAARDIAGPPAEISFSRTAKPSPWWTAAAAVLLLALVAQALIVFRGAIVLVWPGAKPYIQRFCDHLGCEVPLPGRAELMSIESSDLQADPANPGVMVLSATLRNRATFSQAYPALELTLTNERDEPLARRVLGPSDYLKRSAQERKAEDGFASCMGGVPSCELQVKVPFEAAPLKPSGYRLYLFYP